MRGSLRHRGNPGTWEYRLELGVQPAQVCRNADCATVDKKGRRHVRLHWLEGRRLQSCPTCGGELVEISERRERTVGGFRLQSEAQAALDKAKVAVQQGDYVEPSKLSVRKYLIDMWLPSIGATVSPATLRAYTMHVENYIVPRVGATRLQRLSADAIGGMYTDLLSFLSPSTVHMTHVVLHRALKAAVKRGHLARNPTDLVDDAPRAARPGSQGLRTWNAEQLGAFLAATLDDRLGGLWRLLAMTGMRRGEALGLQWEDVDLEAGRLSVRRSLTSDAYVVHVSEPKTAKGRRMLPLDVDTVEALKGEAARQADDRQQWRKAWADTGYVFTAEDGHSLHPDRVSKSFERAVREAMLPRIRLHDLRHTWATLALRAGVHPKVVQERLGHSSISITLDVYSHAIPAMQEEAAELVAALVAGNAEAVAK